MNKQDMNLLRELATRATEGPWRAQTSNGWRRLGTVRGDGNIAPKFIRETDLNFVAMANPQAILALLDKVEALEQECEELAAWKEETLKQQPVAETDGEVWLGTRYAPYALFDVCEKLPDGTKLYTRPIPVPTAEMVIHGAEALHDKLRSEGVDIDFDVGLEGTMIEQRIAEHVFVSMLDAAPQPSKEQGDAIKSACAQVSELPEDYTDEYGNVWTAIDGKAYHDICKKFAEMEHEQHKLLSVCEELSSLLIESRSNDRAAMGYLSQVREIVGGDDFPTMVENIRKLTTQLGVYPAGGVETDTVADLASILLCHGWKDSGDAQWQELAKAVPKIRAALQGEKS